MMGPSKFIFFSILCLVVCFFAESAARPRILQNTSICENGWVQMSLPQKCSCPSGCLSCYASLNSTCNKCNQGFFPKNSTTCKAIPNCPAGTFYNQTSEVCAVCHPTCSTCTGSASSNCTSCVNGTLTGGTCICSTCTACSTGLFKLNNTCTSILQCALGTYYNTTSKACAACHPSCLSCNGPTANNCTACLAGSPTSGQCGCAPGNCSSCPTSYYLKNSTCRLVPTCPNDTYFDQTSESCSYCHSSCLACNGPNINNCTSCKNGTTLQNGSCLCPQGNCTTCPQGFYLQNKTCYPIPTCPNATYFNQTLALCSSCHQSCASCWDSTPNSCTSCSNNTVLQNGYCLCAPGNCTACPEGFYLKNQTCFKIPNCEIQYYFDFNTTVCRPCHQSCNSCNGPTKFNCTSCLTGSLQNGSCLCNPGTCSTCPQDFYLNNKTCFGIPPCPLRNYFNISATVCRTCHQSCLSCDGDFATNCVTCPNRTTLQYGMCLCSPRNCSACPNGFYLQNKTCFPIPECQNGTYFDFNTTSCRACHQSCLTCNGPLEANCTSCLTEAPINGRCCLPGKSGAKCRCASGTVYDEASASCIYCNRLNCLCPTGTYPNFTTTSCEQCPLFCTSCVTSTNCTSCFTGRNLVKGQCISEKNCHASCYNCTGSNTNECITCVPGLLFTRNNFGVGTCTSECPPNHFLSLDGGLAQCKMKRRIENTMDYTSSIDRYVVVFDSSIRNYYREIMDGLNLTIVAKNMNESRNYTYSYYLTSDTSITFNFSFGSPIYTSDTLTLSFTLNTESNSSEYSLKNKKLKLPMLEYFPYSESVKKAIQASAVTHQVGQTANQVFSTVSSLLAHSAHSMRSQSVQTMTSHFVFMNIDYPPNYIEFTKQSLGASPSNPSNDFPALSKNNTDSSSGNNTSAGNNQTSRVLQTSNDEQTANNEILNVDKYLSNQSFIVNFGTSLIYLGASIAAILVVEIAFYICKRKKVDEGKWYFKLMQYGSLSLRWSFFLNQFISSYQNLVFYSLLEAYNAVNTARKRNASLGIAIAGLVIAVLGLVGLFILIRRVYLRLKDSTEEEKEEDHFLKRFKVIHKSFKDQQFLQLLYPFFLMARSLGFMITVILLFNVPMAQLAFLNVSTLGMVIYLALCRPIRLKSQLLVTLSYEILFLVSIVGATTLYVYTQKAPQDTEARTVLAFVIMAANNGMTVLNFVSFGLEVLQVLMILCKKKGKVYPDKEGLKPDLPLKEQAKPGDTSASRLKVSQTKAAFDLLSQDIEVEGGETMKKNDADNITFTSLITSGQSSPKKPLRLTGNFTGFTEKTEDASPTSLVQGERVGQKYLKRVIRNRQITGSEN